jgi:sulfur transfer protein SufE
MAAHFRESLSLQKKLPQHKKREQSTKEMVQDCRKSYLPLAKLLCNQESLHFHTSSLSHLQTCTSYLLDADSRYHQNHAQKIKRKEAPNNRRMLMMMMMMMMMPCAVAHTHLTSIHC